MKCYGEVYGNVYQAFLIKKPCHQSPKKPIGPLGVVVSESTASSSSKSVTPSILPQQEPVQTQLREQHESASAFIKVADENSPLYSGASLTWMEHNEARTVKFKATSTGTTIWFQEGPDNTTKSITANQIVGAVFVEKIPKIMDDAGR